MTNFSCGGVVGKKGQGPQRILLVGTLSLLQGVQREPANCPKRHGVKNLPATALADQPGFHLPPKRWVVERSFGWFMHCRRLMARRPA